MSGRREPVFLADLVVDHSSVVAQIAVTVSGNDVSTTALLLTVIAHDSPTAPGALPRTTRFPDVKEYPPPMTDFPSGQVAVWVVTVP